MKALVMLLVVFCSAACYGQGFDFNRYGNSPLDRYDANSLSNPFGAGSRFKADGLNNPYSQRGSRYSNDSWTNPHAMNAPRLYGSDGVYLGRLSANSFDPDSTSNPYGVYGSRYSPSSINNPYGQYGRYGTEPVYVYPRKR